MAGGGVPESDVEDARAEAGVEHQDPLLLELHPPQLLPVHTRVSLCYNSLGDDCMKVETGKVMII